MNRKYGAVAGGRFVQTTTSPDLKSRWTPWERIGIHRANPDHMDLYFFVVQLNPLDQRTLVALFPVSEPPWACVAAAFSCDGVHFSRPINIMNSRVAFRHHMTHSANDRFSGFSARAEDHPVAGIVPDPLASNQSGYLLYIHHLVRGVSYRQGDSHVAAYALPAAVLRGWTERAVKQLGAAQCGSTAG